MYLRCAVPLITKINLRCVGISLTFLAFSISSFFCCFFHGYEEWPNLAVGCQKLGRSSKMDQIYNGSSIKGFDAFFYLIHIP